jgi:prepilin-type N-terminal cleavage/methylation domain-containing protein
MIPAAVKTAGNKEPHVRRNRRGFTMIEILVAIGIIATLTALLFLGFKYVSKSSRDNQTHVVLQNLRGMLTEYTTSGGSIDKLEDGYREPPNPATSDFPATLTIKAPSGSVAEDMPTRNAPAINQTRIVMNRILAVPSNQKILDSLPPDTVSRNATGIVLLDGYRNPIIFVPRRGMTGVNLVKTGAGTFDKANQTIASPGAKVITAGTPNIIEGVPFFASAGEDNDFSSGDDNHYSYEQ